MIDPDELRRVSLRLRRLYTITIHRDLRRWRLRPWWATMTHGVFHVGEPGGDVWRARTRERLLARCERWIARDMLRNGQRGHAEIRVTDDA